MLIIKDDLHESIEHDFSNLNAITYETVLDFIEEAKKYAKEEAIRDYHVK
jgi:hypothetical protein